MSDQGAIVHDLGCTEPCTCGAWDKAARGESELTRYIDRKLSEAFHQKLVDYGYWCPRCDVEALPLDDGEPGVTPGWCPFCGLDPKTPGSAPKQATLRGLRRLLPDAS